MRSVSHAHADAGCSRASKRSFVALSKGSSGTRTQQLLSTPPGRQEGRTGLHRHPLPCRVSVSRAIKPFAEPGRPPDWFSQKHCASQYSELLETTETPKRKRGEKGEVVETVEDVIVRKLTAERVEELKKMIKETQEKYRQLKRDAELIQTGHMDNRLEDLCNEIMMKKKMEEEEAEVKKKATDAAYQARQAVKNPPRRLTGVMVRSPAGSTSPGGDYALGDLSQPAVEEASPGVGESDMAVASGHMNSSGVLLEVGSVLPVLHGGDMQLASGAVPASPAASGAPTLSRLLEAGPAQFTTPLASFSAVASEPPAKLLPPPVEAVSQATIVMMPTLSAPSVVPPAATPESVATVSQPETCVSMEAVSDPHTVTVSMDSSEISMIIDSIKKECLASGAGSAAGPSKDHSMDGKEDLDLAEKMDIAVSYTGEELDFETVGDIIAIIEDKVDDHPEVLDVAAVEAALSFCEETDDPQALTGPWEHPIQQEHEKQTQMPQVAVTVKQERLDCEEAETKGIRDLMSLGELGPEIKTEPTEQEQSQLDPEEATVAVSRTAEMPELRSRETDEEQRAAAAGGENSETEAELAKGDEGVHNTVKTEAPPDDDSPPPQVPNMNEDSSQPDVQHKFELSGNLIQPRNILPARGEEDDEDGASEAPSLEEPKEEDQGEGYLSEMDNEPPVSESDDGFSVHNAPLQSHTLADSIPSSPASSQFSVCSEDQEAIQAQKIWKKAIMLVWRAAANHRYANVFLQPVTDDIAPGYHSIVQRPMDLSTIKKNIENGLIRTTAEFQRDIMLMFQNAVMYNSSDHDVYHMAVEMQRDVLEQIQQFLATQLIMQTSESGISAKSLRGRDSTRKQDNGAGTPDFWMGHTWMWLDSERESLSESEKSSCCQSLHSSWDSSLDLEVRRWRKTGDSCWEELEGSSQEEACRAESCEPLIWELLLKVAGRCEQDSLLHAVTVLQVLMPSGSAAREVVPRQGRLGSWAQVNPKGGSPKRLQERVHWEMLPHGAPALYIPGHTPWEVSSVGPSLNLKLSWDDPLQRMHFKKTLLSIWKMIASHRYSGPFLKPVSDKQAPGYKDVVKRPMDLTTIKRSLSKGNIRSTAQFQRDLMLMFHNAVMYNSADHHVHHMAVEMQQEVLEQLQMLGEALLCSQDRLRFER
uniref:Bromodomain-containing protein 8 n=1 Tax=Crocodylus porosus TaxID=8502 RepID=A0A7M4F7Z0_CROPO